jgi:hypothetical protein
MKYGTIGIDPRIKYRVPTAKKRTLGRAMIKHKEPLASNLMHGKIQGFSYVYELCVEMENNAVYGNFI